MNPQSLSDYIKEREARKPKQPRKPEWILRMQATGLPPKDYTRGPKDAA